MCVAEASARRRAWGGRSELESARVCVCSTLKDMSRRCDKCYTYISLGVLLQTMAEGAERKGERAEATVVNYKKGNRRFLNNVTILPLQSQEAQSLASRRLSLEPAPTPPEPPMPSPQLPIT